ncbi:hypothetical protein BG454_15595 [Roseinatronobacter bogoriensis subsp. barguzinensis]|uniref:Uncharacterized protein n=1 Tax=Roseinatronobacter bogoriensis subsp. barguzinensis TaxID=441209 RepID=A0A2K8KCA3_9RHOB|nr:hypothetical protein BG454_15595 [Rhodobaca barguzinensis]
MSGCAVQITFEQRSDAAAGGSSCARCDESPLLLCAERFSSGLRHCDGFVSGIKLALSSAESRRKAPPRIGGPPPRHGDWTATSAQI